MDRNETIKRIKAALQKRSGKTWSVTGGTGTAWGWIRIDAPPARRTKHYRLKDGLPDWPENYESYEDGTPGGYTTDTDKEELKRLLNLDSVHDQGIGVAASYDWYEEFIDRAEGRAPSAKGTMYWD